MEELFEWGSKWMWDYAMLTGYCSWISGVIASNTLFAALDGSYMKYTVTDSCSTAIILEFSVGTGHQKVVFATRRSLSNAHWGEFLGLLAKNLIHKSIKKKQPTLGGKVPMYCVFQGVIKQIQDLPLNCLLVTTKQTHILKLFLNWESLHSIKVQYWHVFTNQDNHAQLKTLSWPAQLSCACNYTANSHFLEHLDNPKDQLLPKEVLLV